jgi:hypothetical protein
LIVSETSCEFNVRRQLQKLAKCINPYGTVAIGALMFEYYVGADTQSLSESQSV